MRDSVVHHVADHHGQPRTEHYGYGLVCTSTNDTLSMVCQYMLVSVRSQYHGPCEAAFT